MFRLGGPFPKPGGQWFRMKASSGLSLAAKGLKVSEADPPTVDPRPQTIKPEYRTFLLSCLGERQLLETVVGVGSFFSKQLLVWKR